MNFDKTKWFYSIPFDFNYYGCIDERGKVAWTKDTFEQYKAKHPEITFSKLISNAAFLSIYDAEHTAKFVDKVATEITRDQYWQALECLPPCRWTMREPLEYFYISEATSGNVHTFYMTNKTHYACADMPADCTEEQIHAMWATITEFKITNEEY